MTVQTVNYNGIELDVHGDYIAKEDCTNSPSEFNIFEVYHLDENIYDLFNFKQIDDLQDLALENYE